MQDDDQVVTSADQDKWVEMADRLRVALERKYTELKSMSASELNNFTDAVNNVFVLSVRAHGYDARVHKEAMLFGNDG